MLCPLSGLSPLGGPDRLIDHEDLDTVSTTMAHEILSYGQVSLSFQDLASIVSSALELTLPPPEYRHIYDLAPKLLDGISDWKYFDPIGIGHFDEDGYCLVDENGFCPPGADVEVRRLDEYSSYGRFHAIIVDDGESGERSERKPTFCRSTKTDSCNFFVMRGCLEYLRVWLDPSLPQRVASMDSTPSMNLEGELYEIVNSRHEITGMYINSFIHAVVKSSLYAWSLFPSFQYGDISKTLEMEDQFRFLKARKGSRHTSRAISAGLRGKELLPALFGDFQCWLSMRPDM